MVPELALTTFAEWLTSIFFSMDCAVLEAFHRFAQTAFGRFAAAFLNLITLTGWKGAFLIFVSIVLILFRKTRRTGLCTLLALAIGAIFTNVIVKNAVARPRPYDFDSALRMWWESAGSHLETDYSFPSGHMTAACGFTSGFVLTRGRKWLIPGIVYVFLMGISRMIIVVHYPSDVLGGLLFGVCAGVISYFIVAAVYRKWGQSKLLHE